MSFNTNRFETQYRAPNTGGTQCRGSSPGVAERINAIIQNLKRDEKEMNTMIITVGALSASLVWGIIRHLQLLEQAAQPAAQYSWTHSPRIAVPPVPRAPVLALAPSGSSLLWGIAYWSTSLVFSLSAIVVAVVVKMAIREHRADLRRHGRPLEKAQTQDHSDPVLHVAADTMYRLYQVSLVVLLLGVVNFCLCPVGATIFVPTVICGFLYVLQGVHPRVRKVIRSSSP